MANRPSSSKRDRERAKKLRSDEKRARRQEATPTELPAPDTVPARAASDVFAELAQTQEAFDLGRLNFEEYELRKAELLSALDVG